MAIRVLRLLEYVYENEGTASQDMARWTHVHNTGSMQMRSATLPFEAAGWPPGGLGGAIDEVARLRTEDGWLHTRLSHGSACADECVPLYRAVKPLRPQDPPTQ